MAVKIDGMTNVLVVYNSEDADEIDVRLRMEKIACVRKRIGAGKHGNFLMAMNNFGEELYVQPEDEAAAREVIAKWRRERQEERENQKQNPETESSEKTGIICVAAGHQPSDPGTGAGTWMPVI